MAKINTMILIILSYLLTSLVVLYLCKKRRIRYNIFPKLNMTKCGINFFSYSRHRIRIDEKNFMILKDRVYIKTAGNFVILKNVGQIFYHKNYLYFSAMGDCKFFFDCKQIFRQFNILIESEYFDFDQIKQLALLDIINNQFELKKCKILIKYLKLIKHTLNIQITDSEIKVKANKYNIPFTLIYKLNDKIKKVNIE